MANPADSEAHFDERANAYGLPAVLLTELKNNGIRTLGHLAFAIFRPGADFDENVFNQWARDLNQGVAPTMGALAALRRLHFESEVVLTASLKATVEATEPMAPKQIPIAERNARLAALRQRLTGVNIHGVGEPSHSLIDEACHQYETRTLKYIEPVKCTSRELEVTSGKADKKLKLDAGTLTVKESKQVPDETVWTTYHLAQCLRRRGLAYDFANLVTFNVHEQYVDQLLRHLSVDPPPNYQAPTLQQIIRTGRCSHFSRSMLLTSAQSETSSPWTMLLVMLSEITIQLFISYLCPEVLPKQIHRLCRMLPALRNHILHERKDEARKAERAKFTIQ